MELALIVLAVVGILAFVWWVADRPSKFDPPESGLL